MRIHSVDMMWVILGVEKKGSSNSSQVQVLFTLSFFLYLSKRHFTGAKIYLKDNNNEH